MNLTLYYIAHTFINSIKKIFRTWVAFFVLFMVIMMVIGAGIGFTAGYLIPEDPTAEESVEEYEDEDTADADAEDEGMPLDVQHALEAIPLAIILLTVLYSVYSADKSGTAIFNMADVNFLFTSPLMPTSVLMFRMNMQMGAKILSTLYILFQIPNLLNAGVSIVTALLLMAAWTVNLIMCQIISVFTYTILSGGKKPKTEMAKRFVMVAAVALVGGFLYLSRSYDGDYLTTAGVMFDNHYWQWLPLIGWQSAFCVNVIHGNVALAAAFMAATIVGTGLLFFITTKLPSDFYEDALPGAERNQAVLEAKTAGKTEIEIKPKKGPLAKFFNKSRKNFAHGAGAQMFLMRNLHDRRYGYLLGFFTKTCDTYLILAAGLSLLNILLLHDASLAFGLYFAAMAFVVFMRAFANPLAEEMQHDFIYLVPEKPSKKLFYSLMCGVIESLMNTIPSWLIVVVLVQPKVIWAVAGLILLLVLDLFITIASALVSLIMPTQISDMIRSWMQMIAISMAFMFVVIFTVIGAVLGGIVGCFVTTVVAMIVMSVLMFIPCPLVLATGRK